MPLVKILFLRGNMEDAWSGVVSLTAVSRGCLILYPLRVVVFCCFSYKYVEEDNLRWG